VKYLACAFAMLTSPVAAEVNYDPMVLEVCMGHFEADQAQATCIGWGTQACLRDLIANTPATVAACTAAEAQDWDNRLNDLYATTIVQQKIYEQVLQSHGHVGAVPEDLLRDMQRKWVVYRDAACGWDQILWNSGQGTETAQVDCMMQLTAQQFLYLYHRTE
jgi:uncharacterized protein YecT (DUF1311 family)